MGNRSHTAGLTVREVNLSCRFCLRGSDILFAAEPFIDEVLGRARVYHRVDRNLSFRAV